MLYITVDQLGLQAWRAPVRRPNRDGDRVATVSRSSIVRAPSPHQICLKKRLCQRSRPPRGRPPPVFGRSLHRSPLRRAHSSSGPRPTHAHRGGGVGRSPYRYLTTFAPRMSSNPGRLQCFVRRCFILCRQRDTSFCPYIRRVNVHIENNGMANARTLSPSSCISRPCSPFRLPHSGSLIPT